MGKFDVRTEDGRRLAANWVRACGVVVFESTHFKTVDTRKDYGEQRILCYGMLRDRMVVVSYTPRGADRHGFSMRKANDREQALIAPSLGKKLISIRLPEDVILKWRATGPGWQTRMAEKLARVAPK